MATTDLEKAKREEEARQRAKIAVRDLLDAEQRVAAAKNYEPPREPTMTEFLDESHDSTPFRIGKLMRVGYNCTITAQYKTGKSTLMLNLVKSLADGDAFLGEFPVIVPDGNIMFWNMELPEDTFRDWCRDVRLTRTDRVRVANFRGKREPLFAPEVQDALVERMKRNEIEVWIIDPAARITSGWPGFEDPENSNACITQVTETLDEIKERAGIKELFIPLHTGREGSKRARGATRWDDWTDVRLVLYKDEKLVPGQEIRILQGEGRDTERFKRPLTYVEPARKLIIESSIEEFQERNNARAVVIALRNGPLDGTALAKAIKGVSNNEKTEAVNLAESMGWVVREKSGSKVITRLNQLHPDVIAMEFDLPRPGMETL